MFICNQNIGVKISVLCLCSVHKIKGTRRQKLIFERDGWKLEISYHVFCEQHRSWFVSFIKKLRQIRNLCILKENLKWIFVHLLGIFIHLKNKKGWFASIKLKDQKKTVHEWFNPPKLEMNFYSKSWKKIKPFWVN